MDVKKIKPTYEALQWDDSRPPEELAEAMRTVLFRAGVNAEVVAISEKSASISTWTQKTKSWKDRFINWSEWLVVRSDGKVRILSSEDFDRKFEGKF